MFKHPWLLKNYHPSEGGKVNRRADQYYWACVVVSAVCFGVYGFWVNYLELMNRALKVLSIPSAIMGWGMIMLLGFWFCGTLSRKGKYIAGTLFLITTLISTNTIWTLMN
jgi:hypothetical protein